MNKKTILIFFVIYNVLGISQAEIIVDTEHEQISKICQGFKKGISNLYQNDNKDILYKICDSTYVQYHIDLKKYLSKDDKVLETVKGNLNNIEVSNYYGYYCKIHNFPFPYSKIRLQSQLKNEFYKFKNHTSYGSLPDKEKLKFLLREEKTNLKALREMGYKENEELEYETVYESVQMPAPSEKVVPPPPPPPPPPIVQDEVDMIDDIIVAEEAMETPPIRDSNTVYSLPDKRAIFSGGENKLYEYLSTKLQYPEKALDSERNVTIYANFIIEKDGSITNIETFTRKKEESTDYLFKNEAERVIKSMPNWIPAEQRGKKVRSRFTLPIRFVK